MVGIDHQVSEQDTTSVFFGVLVVDVLHPGFIYIIYVPTYDIILVYIFFK